MKKIFNVKQAAKILGVSTNTMYKYLNHGTVSAARGHGHGSFHIPIRSLELFLGGPIPPEALAALDKELSLPPPDIHSPQQNRTDEVPSVTSSESVNLTLKVIRYLLLSGLILVIIDVATTAQFNIINQLSRISILALLVLLAYQQGGFIKK